MKIIDIVSKKAGLFAQLVNKEEAIRRSGRGTFFRAGRASKSSAKWKHKAYPGEVVLARRAPMLVEARIRTNDKSREWLMLRAFLGFIDRHCGEGIETVTIRYR